MENKVSSSDKIKRKDEIFNLYQKILEENLTKDKENRTGWDNVYSYLERRDISDAEIEKMSIGAAKWNDIFTLKNQGVSMEELEELGLAQKSRATGKHFSAYRDRAMFVLKDERGNIAGWSGRAVVPSLSAEKEIELKENDPKSYQEYAGYIENMESDSFRKYWFSKGFVKGDILCGIEDDSKEGPVIICEGIADRSRLLSVLRECDVNGTVLCLLGKDMTQRQLDLLEKRISKDRDIVIFTDMDRAGMEAKAKIGTTLRGRGYEKVYGAVSRDDTGKDPDELFYGKEMSLKLLNEEIELCHIEQIIIKNYKRAIEELGSAKMLFGKEAENKLVSELRELARNTREDERGAIVKLYSELKGLGSELCEQIFDCRIGGNVKDIEFNEVFKERKRNYFEEKSNTEKTKEKTGNAEQRIEVMEKVKERHQNIYAAR